MIMMIMMMMEMMIIILSQFADCASAVLRRRLSISSCYNSIGIGNAKRLFGILSSLSFKGGVLQPRVGVAIAYSPPAPLPARLSRCPFIHLSRQIYAYIIYTCILKCHSLCLSLLTELFFACACACACMCVHVSACVHTCMCVCVCLLYKIQLNLS